MDNICRMDIKAASEQLIHEILAVIIGEVLTGVNNSMHISFHEIGDDVNIFITGRSRGLLDIDKTNYIFMVEEF